MVIRADIEDKVFNINDIINEAQPFDIIIFNNNIIKWRQFSFTSLLVKFGSKSGWNHAALVMGEEPTHANMNGYQTALPICKCRRKHQGQCKYIYEYAASRRPITYQTLEEKLDSEGYNSIALIRFKKFNTEINKNPSDMISAKNFVINDFNLRMGCSTQEWKNRVKNKKPKPSYKYTYNTTNIVHRTFLTLAILGSAAVFISFPFALFSQFARVVLGGAIVCILIAFPTIKLMEHFNIKRYKKVIARRAICSGYPPEILCSLIFDPIKERTEINDFNSKWIQGTPPSPANLHQHAVTSQSCVVYNYKKKSRSSILPIVSLKSFIKFIT
ncbi:hypothetical protein [Pantoea agglomerans]|uniref:hypothetical protein n=1 Tax=Enterobacter agglomerans TaxID=549 RepID=UPI0013035CDD|nr:hypothetical protein [Pantoea agglomerans]